MEPDEERGSSNVTDPRRARLQFVDVPVPGTARDQKKARIAHSHAITTALANKRNRAQQTGNNFQVTTITDQNSIFGRNPPLPIPPGPLAIIQFPSIDPFETLSVNARRLTTLLNLKSSMRAGEPVFNVNDAVRYQSLQSVFETGLDDGALTAALSLTLAYAANGFQTNRECIQLSCVAMQHLRQRLSDPVFAASSATIGAVLLLLGNSYRLGDVQSAQSHLHGLRILLDMCSQRNVPLPAALKRAIYWQDLFSSIFLQTDRIVQYASFYPHQQATIESRSSSSKPPSGFARLQNLFSSEFLAITADVAALYDDRPKYLAQKDSLEGQQAFDDVQAELEGRIHSLRQVTTSDMLLACIMALQLCVYGFWDGVWNASLIPRELSTRLLHHLCRCREDDFEGFSLFVWLVYTAKAFAVDAWVREELDKLWFKRPSNEGKAVFPSWNEVLPILNEFIWSEVLYSEDRGWFWERISE